MLDEHDRDPPLVPDAPQEPVHAGDAGHAQAGGGLVQEQERGLPDEGAGDLGEPLLPVAEVGGEPVPEVVHLDDKATREGLREYRRITRLAAKLDKFIDSQPAATGNLLPALRLRMEYARALAGLRGRLRKALGPGSLRGFADLWR